MDSQCKDEATGPVPRLMRQGMEHLQARRLAQAEVIFRGILEQAPEHTDALHLLGAVAHQSGRHDEALALVERAIAASDSVWAYHHNRGEVLRALARLPEAVGAYRRAIVLNPENVDTHQALALVHQELGQVEGAVRHYWRALTLQPQAAGVHHSLGIALCRLGRIDEAIHVLRQATALAPADARVHHDLGVALAGAGFAAPAAAIFGQAIALQPDFVSAHLRLGAIQLRQGNTDEALATYRRAAELDPNDVGATDGLAHVLEKRGEIEEAIRVHRETIARHGDSPVHRFYLASLGAACPPEVAPTSFVVSLFDGYAEHFDAHLAKLEYRTPQLLFDAVAAAGSAGPRDILDLGCGTGLCGALFKPLAASLTGVDLSPRMIDKARERKVYDRLVVGELADALQSFDHCLDLVLAADVFVYVGDLGEVFRRAAGALRPQGLFAFSVEAMEVGSFALRATRRYTHSLAYLRQLAGAHGFAEASARAATLRQQGRQDVAGFIVVLRRVAC